MQITHWKLPSNCKQWRLEKFVIKKPLFKFIIFQGLMLLCACSRCVPERFCLMWKPAHVGKANDWFRNVLFFLHKLKSFLWSTTHVMYVNTILLPLYLSLPSAKRPSSTYKRVAFQKPICKSVTWKPEYTLPEKQYCVVNNASRPWARKQKSVRLTLYQC